jgi:hypothetical protein
MVSFHIEKTNNLFFFQKLIRFIINLEFFIFNDLTMISSYEEWKYNYDGSQLPSPSYFS